MPKLIIWSRLWSVLMVLHLLAGSVSAVITSEQRQEIESLNGQITEAARLFLQGKYEDSGSTVRQVQANLETLSSSGDAEVLEALGSAYQRLLKRHALLELEGIALPPLKKLEQAGSPPGDTSAAPEKMASTVSFRQAIAPFLLSKCGRCHVDAARGRVSMASYATLMKGPPTGAVVKAGDTAESKLVEVIRRGDMPRGGLTVTSDEFTALKQWVAEGAQYDDGDPQLTLAELATAAPVEDSNDTEMQTTAEQTISFSRDIAPVLNEKCANCHGRGTRPGNRLNLVTFSGLMRGGDNGPPVTSGKPAESLLVTKLRGTADGQRMPSQQSPLDDSVIAKFEAWIAAGAKYDGVDDKQDIQEVAELASAEQATPEQLSRKRVELALKNWRLGMPGVDADQVETKGLFLLGNIGQDRLQQCASEAESVRGQVAEVFGAPSDKPLIKGGITLILLARGYDYSEFGRMVEKRDLPAQSKGHWRFTVVDAYGVSVPSSTGAYAYKPLVAQQMSGIYVASLGNIPRWFAEGSARAVAARIGPQDARVEEWDGQVEQIASSMSKSDDFLTGKLAPESADIASYSFVKLLMSDARRYSSLLGELRAGRNFQPSFSKAYGGSPAQGAEIWVRRMASKTSRSRPR